MWFLFTTTRAQYSIRDTEATYFIYQFNAIECPLPCMPKMCSPDIFIVEKLQLNLCGETVNWMASKWGRHTFIYTDSVPLYVLLTLFMRISVFLVRVRELPHNQWLFYHIFFCIHIGSWQKAIHLKLNVFILSWLCASISFPFLKTFIILSNLARNFSVFRVIVFPFTRHLIYVRKSLWWHAHASSLHSWIITINCHLECVR